ncbi:hypothetical protein SAMN05443661_11912 [Natronobacterium gregoryi]|uniref:Uncharacterized protein n=2 Tax=Natronobacterium gregoryi TaxID=44930 RepID=L0AEX5_NATGS|nr:hypothetical protein Natgr_0417 [Natronobacterium gregoryi SP2]SFJ24743.1 hypothetical protein SAMN05443661_11912 [Natronobacterium gregoryi]
MRVQALSLVYSAVPAEIVATIDSGLWTVAVVRCTPGLSRCMLALYAHRCGEYCLGLCLENGGTVTPDDRS